MDDAWSQKLTSLCELLGSGFLVVLLGDRGTGKTQMACELVRSQVWREERNSCLYVHMVEIFMAIKAAFSKQAVRAEAEELQRFISPQLLIIDEAHDRGDTAWEDRVLSYLIDKRYGDLRDTLIISNQKPGEFKKSIGPSIYSRLIETGGIIECPWPSFRTKALDPLHVPAKKAGERNGGK